MNCIAYRTVKKIKDNQRQSGSTMRKHDNQHLLEWASTIRLRFLLTDTNCVR